MVRPARASHRRVLALSGPLILASLSTPLLALVETAIAGHLPQSYYLGAVAVGTMVFNYVYWAFSFLRMSTTGLVAQARGAGRPDEIRTTLARAALIALAAGFVLVALAAPLKGAAFSLLSSSAEVKLHAERYVGIRIWSAPAALLNYVLLGWLMGMQRSGLAMVMEIFRGVTNVALALLFVWGFGWEVPGVAGASVAAEWIAATISLLVAVRALRRVATPWAWRTILDGGAFRRLFGLNGDLFIRTQCLLIVFTSFTAGGAALGDATLAANAVLMNLFLLISYALGAYGQAASALVGSAVGEGNRSDLRQAMRVTTGWALGSAALASAAIGLGGNAMVRLLSGVAEVRTIAAGFLPYAAAMPLVSVLSFQLDGIAVGATRTGLVRNVLLVSFGAFLLIHWLLVPALGNHGLWLAMISFMVVRSSGFFLCYRALLGGHRGRSSPG
jgi:MATE family multidrug resistance protein